MLDTAMLWGRVKESAHGRVEPTYGIFPTGDGLGVAVAILEDHIWPRLCLALDWNDWNRSASLATYAGRVASAAEIRDRLAAACLSLTLRQLLDLAHHHDLPVTPAGTSLGPLAAEQFTARYLGGGYDRRLPLPLSVGRPTSNGSPAQAVGQEEEAIGER